jgi:hypothetical protein
LISECGGCKDNHYLNVKTCIPCDVACNGCTGAGNGKCKVCSTSGVKKYILHEDSKKCLVYECGNKENHFEPVAGTLFCDVGKTPTGVNADACKSCEVQKGYYCTAKDWGTNIDGS